MKPFETETPLQLGSHNNPAIESKEQHGNKKGKIKKHHQPFQRNDVQK